ncbi:hypothetical protein ABZ631_15080, partial [Nocardiopsis alba]|uniref:hypothetical protein n=1 Tax=Nocardiopsis alba TaxID=53437 RepID=UPI0033E297FC
MSTPVSTPQPQGRRPVPSFVSPTVTVLSFLVLMATGAATGVLSGFGVSWFAREWPLGGLAQVKAVAGVLLLLVALYALTRLAGWGSRRQSGALGFSAGFALSLMGMIGYLPGGDIIFPDAIINYVFLFGSMVALALGVVRSAAPFQWDLLRGSVRPGPGTDRRSGPPPGAGARRSWRVR